MDTIRVIRPAHSAGYSRKLLLGALFVGSVHLALLWAFVNGLTPHIPTFIPPDLIGRVLPTPAEHPPLPPDNPPVDWVKPTGDTVTPPVFTTDTGQGSGAITVTLTAHSELAYAATAIASTHTAPTYPPAARRLGQEGTVRLHLVIATDGSVSAVQVTASSGSEFLDQAAADWVKAHWRYHPAIRNGAAVESSTDIAVTFNLKNAS